jgi:hypothetical protein
MKRNCVILKWNPAISSYSMLRFLNAVSWCETESDWSIYEYEKVRAGDRFFMLKVGCGTCGIVAAGEITSDPAPGEDWSGRKRKVYYADYSCDFMVNPETLPILESSFLEIRIPGFDWYGGHSGVVPDDETGRTLNRLFEQYLRENAAVFTDRLELMEKRCMDNDQIYIDEDLLDKIKQKK